LGCLFGRRRFAPSRIADFIFGSFNRKTASEIDNLGFIVSRATIEKGNAQKNWETIASYQQTETLKGQGTTLSESSYAYLDRTVETGKEYAYKLQSVDLNGALHHYDLIAFASGKPLSYRLEQNYPNPFNPNTTIRYQLPKASQVKLEIFDMIGKKVSTLLYAKQEAGEYLHTLRASNFSLSSGVYFYRLQADDFIETKKMVLVK
jgi:hypothetical protein